MSETLNKALLKKFAVDARNELRDKISLKASLYGITKDISDKDRKTNGTEGFIKNEEVVIEFNNQKRTLSKDEASQRTALIDKIQRINREGRDGFDEVIEEVSYTWFNRFVALRYMEVNGYLQSKVNVLASRDGSNTPEIITEAMNVNLHIDKNLVYELKRDNKIDELYSYLVELQCSELNKSLPFMFEKLGHYAELLFPAGVISSKFFKTLIDTESITEDDWSNVEIIGWLYQYYISEEKDRVIKAKKKYKKNEIPFATQLFTPDWIVRYMVQNSLGRYWIESHKDDEDLKENWEFYLENPEKEPDFDEKIAPYINNELEVEDIKCFDPACGSGHILVYMFDVLHEIYSKCGYSRGDIPMLIIEKNLYGLDIDRRAYQLACFAVIMKGMSYDKLLLRKIERQVNKEGKYISLNIACIQETNILYEDENSSLHDNIAFLAGEESGETYGKVKAFVESLKNANTYGSLTIIEGFDKEFLETRLEYIKNIQEIDFFQSKAREKWEFLLDDLIKQAYIMEQTYDILVTNPPYMGSKYMNTDLTKYIKKNYISTKTDLFSVFINYSIYKVKRNGHSGFMAPFVWMFISSYEKLRNQIINEKNITSLIQLEYSAFEDATVPICTFIIRNYNCKLKGEYIKLSDFRGADLQPIKVKEAVINKEAKYRYTVDSDKFNDIKGKPIAYWADEEIFSVFKESNLLGDSVELKIGLQTSDTNRFLRYWYEINYEKVGFNYRNEEETKDCLYKWFPYNKGGKYRKWYGNYDYVVNFENRGNEIRKWCEWLNTQKTSMGVLVNKEYYFKKGLTWNLISSANFGVRCYDEGMIFDVSSCSLFCSDEEYYFYAALLNSKLIRYFVNMLNPTLNFSTGVVSSIPNKYISGLDIENINDNVKNCINIAKEDWNEYENSWNFKYHPLLNYGDKRRLEQSVLEFERKKINDKNNMLILEVKINDAILNMYKIEKCLIENIDETDITIETRSNSEIIKSFLSYFIGVVFGRYSLDKEGLIFAGGKFDINEYNKFIPDEDNIIPVLNSETKYFEDDVMGRFEEFLKVTFGEEYLSENIDFIAETLEMKPNESSREAIRRYFANDFYYDHKQTYKNTPIYWLFTSGKNKAFSCLVYMHRIDKNLLSKMRIDYVQPLQNKLEVEQKDLIDTLNSDATTKDKKDAKKKLGIVEKQIDELKVFHEKLRHMADKQIEVDLDDGVVYNHGLFGDLVAKIK